MKRYLVTLVAMTRETRRRAGKSWTTVVEALDAERVRDIETRVEQSYAHHDKEHNTVKVIDIREVKG